jgi:hypothetical protein
MNKMLFPKLSLILNILVLIPVCTGVLLNANWAVEILVFRKIIDIGGIKLAFGIS